MDVGYGFQGPLDSVDDSAVIKFLTKRLISKLSTTKLVKVIKVTGGGGAIARAGTVDVQLLVNTVDGAGNGRANSIVHGLPWWRMQGGGNAIICDPVVGEVGYVLCSDRDISAVKSALAADRNPQVNPGSARVMSVSDGIYVGGFMNSVPTQYIRFTENGISITTEDGSVVDVGNGGDITLTPSSGIVKVNGAIHATGDVISRFGTVGAVNGATHVHPTAALGPPSPPTPGT